MGNLWLVLERQKAFCAVRKAMSHCGIASEFRDFNVPGDNCPRGSAFRGLMTEPLQGQGTACKSKTRKRFSLRREARKNLGLLIPAALYAVNSYLKFVMLIFFRPTTAKMLGNLKVCFCKTRLRKNFQHKWASQKRHRGDSKELGCISVSFLEER